MEKKVVVVCIIAAVLGLLSAAMGLAADAKKIKVTVDLENNECTYPASPASALGYAAAITLLMALIIINAATGCYYCDGRRSCCCECNVALVFFVFSWITFVPAFLLLLDAAALNGHNISIIYYDGCYVGGSHAFAAAACLSFISVALGITYYLTFTSVGKTPPPSPTNAAQSYGVAMGHPQVPTTTAQQPAIAHQGLY